MAVQPFNLFTYKQRFLFSLEDSYKARSSATFTDPMIFAFLNEAQLLCQEELHWIKALSTAVTMTAGTDVYDVPVGVMGAKIDKVEILDTSGEWGDLDHVAHYTPSIDTSDRDEPTEWAWHPTTANSVIIYPVPDRTATSTLRFTTASLPTQLSRIWRQTTITAAMTNDSTAVTLSASGSAVNIRAGDHLGVVPTTGGDGTTLSSEGPIVWYEISTFDGTTGIVLTEVYDAAAAATASIVVAQVSDFEKRYPGKLGHILTDLAVALSFEHTAPDMSARMMQKGMSRLMSLKDDRVGAIPKGRQQATILPSFFWRGTN